MAENNNQLSLYTSLKEGIRGSLKQMSQEFIAVGFYLKRIRDEKLFEQDGFQSVWEFAWDTYRISKSTCSRWMAMNDKFSEGGNSPMIDPVYQDFGKSQLQEMLYLSDEQMEQAVPEMPAKEIRLIRTPDPEPVPDIELKKPGVEEERYLNSLARYLIEVKYDWMYEDHNKRVMDVTASPEELKQHLGLNSRSWYFATGDDRAAHANLFDDYVQVWNGAGECLGNFEWFYLAREIQTGWNEVAVEKAKAAKQTPEDDWKPFDKCTTGMSQYPNACSCCGKNGVHCCADCNEPCSGKCGWPEDEEDFSAVRCVTEYCETKSPLRQMVKICEDHEKNADRAKAFQELLAPDGYKSDSVDQVMYEFRGYSDGVIFREGAQLLQISYIQFVKEFEEIYGLFGDQEDEIPEEQEEAVAPAQQEVLEAEYKEVQDEEYTPEYFLEEHKLQLKEWVATFSGDGAAVPAKPMARLRILVEALELLVMQSREQEVVEQPELPLLKNNDQRKQWLRNYKDWGVWYRDDNIGVTYYKYDFDDGTRLVAEEYPSKYQDYSSYLHLVGGPSKRPRNTYGADKYPYHETYSRYPDSESEIVEFLKHIQKGSK